MRKLKQTICFFAFWASLVCITMIATQTLLLAHVLIQHQHDCHHDHSGHSSCPLNPHQHSKCRTCETLLGPAGKYICRDPEPNALGIEQISFPVYFHSHFIPAGQTASLSPRAPPAA